MSRKYNSATARLRQDYMRLKKDPVPYLRAEPLPSNILEWHYVVTGPENTPYEGGLYHGKLVFPSDFPYKPPSIYMLTPNGRFKCHTRLCLSISDFHPDMWNPAWSVSTILTGLLSFMVEKNPTLGSIETSDYEKRQFAWRSGEHNLGDKHFCQLFPELVKEIRQELERRKKEENTSGAACPNEVTSSSSLTMGALRFQNHLNQDQGIMGSALANLLAIIGFAAFAFSVKKDCSQTAQQGGQGRVLPCQKSVQRHLIIAPTSLSSSHESPSKYSILEYAVYFGRLLSDKDDDEGGNQMPQHNWLPV